MLYNKLRRVKLKNALMTFFRTSTGSLGPVLAQALHWVMEPFVSFWIESGRRRHVLTGDFTIQFDPPLI
jgi:hypothetical protein